MNRIVKFILTVFLICLGVFASAQEYIVKSFEIIPDDIDARVNSRVGYNGRKCALLKVYVQDGINHVNGSVVGDIETKGMEKRIYLAHDSKQVELVFENHFPLRIKFDDYNIPVVTEQTVYVLKLTEDGGQASQDGVNNSNIGNGVKVSAGATKQPVTFKITPSNAILTVDQKECATTNGIAEIMLSPEEHTYVVVAQGYNTQGGKFLVDENNTNKIIVELDPRAPSEGGGQTLQNEVNNSSNGVGRDFVETAAGLNMNMVYVAGGTFMMGASASDSEAADYEKPAHSVTLSDYYIGKYEVTQKQWVEIMGSNPSNWKGDDLPVECISWNDVQKFIRRLNAKTGKKYRLPTEAEWEFAARGGNSSRGYKYSGSNSINAVAWYSDNSNETHHVGTKSPNELGIYDMSGNVEEWCSDWYDENYYDNSPSSNPKGPSKGAYRVLRGGCWFILARYCRVSYRGIKSPGHRGFCFGFRLALSL